MRKVEVTNKLIVRFNNDYFITNEFTYNLLNAFNESNKLKDISHMLNIRQDDLEIYYDVLKKELLNENYYNSNISLEYPLKFQWKITNTCNLSCKHCYLGDLDNQTLSNDDLMRITDKIINSSVMEVTISGGEALCVKVLPEIVYKLTQNDIYVNIFTNGILLKKFIDNIKLKVNPKKISFEVSVDGTKDVHNSIRGKGTFEKTLQGIKYALKNNYSVTTNTVLSSMNYLDVPRLFLLLDAIKVSKIQISNIIISGNATDSMKLTKMQNDKFIESMKKVLHKTKTKEILYAQMPDEGFSSHISRITKDSTLKVGRENWKCAAGIGRATIDDYGDIYCCPFLDNSYLGNILNENFNYIWNSEKRFKFLKYISEDNRNSRVCIVARSRK